MTERNTRSRRSRPMAAEMRLLRKLIVIATATSSSVSASIRPPTDQR